MRAEGQAHIDRIEAALALVRKFLDWERALRRLDELNARVEDPKLWDNPKAAEEVMRERRRLEAAVGTVNEIGQEMADAIEFVELGEAEGDEATINEGLATLAALAARADNDKVQVIDVPTRQVIKTLQPGRAILHMEFTARGDAVDRILGFEIGADDYLAKPCNPRELVARLRAILRRVQKIPVHRPLIEFHHIVVD